MPTVSIKGENETFELEEGETIFDGLDRQYYDLPHGCLAGSCGACRILVHSGAKNLSEISVVEQNTLDSLIVNYKRIKGEDFFKGKQLRLACRAKVHGDIEVEVLN